MGDIEITTNPVHQEGQSADGRTDFPMIHVSAVSAWGRGPGELRRAALALHGCDGVRRHPAQAALPHDCNCKVVEKKVPFHTDFSVSSAVKSSNNKKLKTKNYPGRV